MHSIFVGLLYVGYCVLQYLILLLLCVHDISVCMYVTLLCTMTLSVGFSPVLISHALTSTHAVMHLNTNSYVTLLTI